MPCEDYEEDSLPVIPRHRLSVVHRLVTYVGGIVHFVYAPIHRLAGATPLGRALHLGHRDRRRHE
jgi:hypothetical protein